MCLNIYARIRAVKAKIRADWLFLPRIKPSKGDKLHVVSQYMHDNVQLHTKGVRDDSGTAQSANSRNDC
jgi:hypothetical protein